MRQQLVVRIYDLARAGLARNNDRAQRTQLLDVLRVEDLRIKTGKCQGVRDLVGRDQSRKLLALPAKLRWRKHESSAAAKRVKNTRDRTIERVGGKQEKSLGRVLIEIAASVRRSGQVFVSNQHPLRRPRRTGSVENVRQIIGRTNDRSGFQIIFRVRRKLVEGNVQKQGAHFCRQRHTRRIALRQQNARAAILQN